MYHEGLVVSRKIDVSRKLLGSGDKTLLVDDVHLHDTMYTESRLNIVSD